MCAGSSIAEAAGESKNASTLDSERRQDNKANHYDASFDDLRSYGDERAYSDASVNDRFHGDEFHIDLATISGSSPGDGHMGEDPVRVCLQWRLPIRF